MMVSSDVRVRKSPFVLLRNIVFVQFIGAAVYFVVAFLGNYEAVYQYFDLPRILSYEIARFGFMLLTEGILMGIVFAEWVFEVYTLSSSLLIHEWGVIVKRRDVVPLHPPLHVRTHFGPFSQRFDYGDVIIKDSSTPYLIAIEEISNPRYYASIIEGNSEKSAEMDSVPTRDIQEHLASREHEKLEFKSSLRWDAHGGNVNRALERTAMKTVAAFLNSEGGTLIIGVDNNGKIMGIAPDYATLPRPDADAFENHFTNIFRDVIGAEFRRFVHLSFHDMEEGEVCMITVLPSTKPVYAMFDNEESFFIRTGNSTTPLRMSQVADYTRSRWGEG